MRILLLLMGLSVLAVGCGPGSMESDPEDLPHIEGTRQDLQILRLEGIRNPDSENGQRRLWKLKRDRERLEAILKEAEDQNLRQPSS